MKRILLIIFYGFFCIIDVVSAKNISPEDYFYLDFDDSYLSDFYRINLNGRVILFDDINLNLAGKNIEDSKVLIKNAINIKYKLQSISYVSNDKVVTVKVIGDIERPKYYSFYKDEPVRGFNKSGRFFDEKLYDYNISSYKEGSVFPVKGSDFFEDDGVYLISLNKRDSSDLESNTSNIVSGIDESYEIESIQHEKTDDPAIIDNPYFLQVGDIVSIEFPDEEGFDVDFLVGRDGMINLPEIGSVKVVDLTIYDVESKIYKALSAAFLGLERLKISLKEGRVLVTILGYVKNPGDVELSSNGNIQTAINKAGGFVDGAQLDILQLHRNGIVKDFNFRKYLNTGDSVFLPALKSLDTIFVPSSPELGNVHGAGNGAGNSNVSEGVDTTEDRSAIKVLGEAKRPGSFSFKEGMTVIDAILRAGGLTRFASVKQIRVVDRGSPYLFNLKDALDTGAITKLKSLSEGATLFIPQVVDSVQGGGRVVYVMGQVQKPGSFETGNNVSFLDVLANAGGPNRFADTRTVRILRANGSVVPFNLANYVEGGGAELPEIKPGDSIFVPERNVLADKSWLKLDTNESVKLIGAIKNPGRYDWVPTLSFLDFLGHAGGPSETADLSAITVLYPDDNGSAKKVKFNLENFIKEGGDWASIPDIPGGSTIIFSEAA